MIINILFIIKQNYVNQLAGREIYNLDIYTAKFQIFVSFLIFRLTSGTIAGCCYCSTFVMDTTEA